MPLTERSISRELRACQQDNGAEEFSAQPWSSPSSCEHLHNGSTPSPLPGPSSLSPGHGKAAQPSAVEVLIVLVTFT